MHSSYQREQLALDQLRIVAENLKPSVVAMPMLALLIGVMFWKWAPHDAIIAWCGIVLVASLPLHFVSQRFFRNQRSGTPVSWVVAFCAAFVTFELAWGSMAIALWVPDNDFDHVLILLLLCSTIAGNCVLAGANFPLTLTAFFVYGPAMVLTPLRSGGVVYDTLAIVSVIFIAFLFHMARVYYGVAQKMLLLGEDKRNLIEKLENALFDAMSARERAESANVAKSQFLANMSHELRTPMNAILGFSEVIKDELMGPNGNPLYRSYAGDIHASGAHLLNLINSVLDLSKIEAGKFELKEVNVDLYEVVEDAARIIRLRAKEKGVQLINDVPRGVCVLADASALRQVALNLATNAVKFTTREGSVRASLFAKDGQFGLLVRDTGCGIKPEDMGKIFEIFGQGKHDVASPEQGTGLGLPISRGLMRAHGGDITVRSTVGTGSSFLVTLPLERILHWPENINSEAVA